MNDDDDVFDPLIQIGEELRSAFPVMSDVPADMTLLIGRMSGKLDTIGEAVTRLETSNQALRDYVQNENFKLAQHIGVTEGKLSASMSATETKITVRLDCVEDKLLSADTERRTIYKVMGGGSVVMGALWALFTYLLPHLGH